MHLPPITQILKQNFILYSSYISDTLFSLLLFSLHFCVSFHFLSTVPPLPFSHFCLSLLTHKSFLPHFFNSFYYSATSSCSSTSLFLCLLVSGFCILFPLFPKIAVISYLLLSRTLCRFYFPFDL